MWHVFMDCFLVQRQHLMSKLRRRLLVKSAAPQDVLTQRTKSDVSHLPYTNNTYANF